MMTEHFEINGAHVATVTVPPSSRLTRLEPATAVHLFHGDSGWSVLTVRLPEPGETTSGVEVRVGRYDSLAEVLDQLHARWPLQSVVEAILDVGHDRYEPDLELEDLWLVSRIDRDFESSWVWNKDLAEGGHFGAPVPAVGRQLPNWVPDALDAMATHHESAGFRILDRAVGDGGRAGPFENPTLGALTVARYGHTVDGTARCDAAGELFIRADWGDLDDEDRGPGTDLAIRARRLRPEHA